MHLSHRRFNNSDTLLFCFERPKPLLGGQATWGDCILPNSPIQIPELQKVEATNQAQWSFTSNSSYTEEGGYENMNRVYGTGVLTCR